MTPELYDRLVEHFMRRARDELHDDATLDEVVFEARILCGRFFGWTPAEGSAAIH